MKKDTQTRKVKIRAICKITGISLLFFSTSLNLLFCGEIKVTNPSKFKVSYSLQKSGQVSGPNAFGAPGLFSADVAASVAVNILDERFFPVKAFVLREVKSSARVESLWDGRDIYGKEMPSGKYYASLSIVFSDGANETKFFKFVKD